MCSSPSAFLRHATVSSDKGAQAEQLLSRPREGKGEGERRQVTSQDAFPARFCSLSRSLPLSPSASRAINCTPTVSPIPVISAIFGIKKDTERSMTMARERHPSVILHRPLFLPSLSIALSSSLSHTRTHTYSYTQRHVHKRRRSGPRDPSDSNSGIGSTRRSLLLSFALLRSPSAAQPFLLCASFPTK